MPPKSTRSGTAPGGIPAAAPAVQPGYAAAAAAVAAAAEAAAAPAPIHQGPPILPRVPAEIPAGGHDSQELAQTLQILATQQQHLIAQLRESDAARAAQAAQASYVLPDDSFLTVVFQRIGAALELPTVEQRRDAMKRVVRVAAAMGGALRRDAQAFTSIFAQWDANPVADPAMFAMQASFFAASPS